MESAADAERLVRENLKALMASRRMNQGDLAALLGLSQAWVSKRLSGKAPPKGSRFQVADLDAIGRVFGITPAALLLPAREWDRRRNGRDRRSGQDRRHYPHEATP